MLIALPALVVAALLCLFMRRKRARKLLMTRRPLPSNCLCKCEDDVEESTIEPDGPARDVSSLELVLPPSEPIFVPDYEVLSSDILADFGDQLFAIAVRQRLDEVSLSQQELIEAVEKLWELIDPSINECAHECSSDCSHQCDAFCELDCRLCCDHECWDETELWRTQAIAEVEKCASCLRTPDMTVGDTICLMIAEVALQTASAYASFLRYEDSGDDQRSEAVDAIRRAAQSLSTLVTFRALLPDVNEVRCPRDLMVVAAATMTVLNEGLRDCIDVC